MKTVTLTEFEAVQLRRLLVSILTTGWMNAKYIDDYYMTGAHMEALKRVQEKVESDAS